MTDQTPGRGGPDYLSCRYGASKVMFRGPRRRLIPPYVTYLGGSETYGRFLEKPYPALVDEALSLRAINLGCPNAGVELYLADESLLEIARKGAATVIECSGAHLNSNRFYAVHPRRNDRFLRASALMQTVYPEIDFMEFNYTRHLLMTLREASAPKFQMVVQELRDAWVARMRTLTDRIGGRVILVWMASRDPDDNDALDAGDAPLFVTRGMIDALRDRSETVIEIVATPQDIAEGRHDMRYAAEDAAAAEEMLGNVVQRAVADRLAQALAGTG